MQSQCYSATMLSLNHVRTVEDEPKLRHPVLRAREALVCLTFPKCASCHAVRHTSTTGIQAGV